MLFVALISLDVVVVVLASSSDDVVSPFFRRDFPFLLIDSIEKIPLRDIVQPRKEAWE